MSPAPRSEFIYVTYIRTTPEKLWAALTKDTEFMKQYWFGTYCESAWTAGAPWKMVQPGGNISDSGEIIEAEPPRRLVIRWQHQQPDAKAEGFSTCTMELEPSGTAVKLSIRHSIEREGSILIQKVSGGWPKVLANLKSLIETGAVVLDVPYPTSGVDASSGSSVRSQIVVAASPARAFAVFTGQGGAWWLRTHKIGKSDLKDAVMEPRPGGRWYEIDVDGSECSWGKVLAWEPPHRVVLAWQINGRWQYDPNLLTEVEVTFTALQGGHTQIDLEHRNLDRFGAEADAVRKAFSGGGGWAALLASFAKLADMAEAGRR
jgi:uncharacterized protein YndB with AHSA1/START domain